MLLRYLHGISFCKYVKQNTSGTQNIINSDTEYMNSDDMHHISLQYGSNFEFKLLFDTLCA